MSNERIEQVLRELAGSHILHVGCVGQAEGKYHLHLELCSRLPSSQVLGLDVDHPGALELKRQGCRMLVADAQRLPLKAAFDTIVAGELIEHLSNPGEFLEGCRRALRPRGRLVITTPNPFSLMYGLMYLKNYKSAFNHEHALWLCPQTIEALAQRCGFHVEKLTFVDDLTPEGATSRWYRAFAYVWQCLRWCVPQRFRNTILAVLETQ